MQIEQSSTKKKEEFREEKKEEQEFYDHMTKREKENICQENNC